MPLKWRIFAASAKSKLLDLLEDLDLFDGCLLAPIVSKAANQTMARSPFVASLLLFLAFFMLNLKLQFSPVWGGIFPNVILACA